MRETVRGPARFFAAGAVAVAAVVAHAAPGHAATAVEVGWWTASPLAAAPDAPPDALVVEGGIAGPLAYGAVRYTLAPDEIPESLTLRLAPGAMSTPMTTLALCPLTEPFTPAQGGPMAEAPAFDCETSVEQPLLPDGATYRFDVAELVGVGELAVAILPTAPTDRVVLEPPDVDALVMADAGVATPGTDRLPTRDAAPDGDLASSTAPVRSGSLNAPQTPRPVVATAPAVPPAATPEVGAPPPDVSPSLAAAPAAQNRSASGGSWLPPAVFVCLALVAAVLWRGAGAGDVAAVSPQPRA